MTDADILTIEAIDRDCWRVRHDESDTDAVVMEITIAGNDLTRPHGAFSLEIECTDWDIEGNYHPALLIESASWYSPPEDSDD